MDWDVKNHIKQTKNKDLCYVESVVLMLFFQEKEKLETQHSFEVPTHKIRQVLDTFGDSLRHVNTLYNKAFGYVARKVPGHMPHMIDRNIMAELQDRY